MIEKPSSPPMEETGAPRLLQEEVTPAPATVHVAVQAVAADEIADELTAENETATLGDSIAMIANQPEEVRDFSLPS